MMKYLKTVTLLCGLVLCSLLTASSVAWGQECDSIPDHFLFAAGTSDFYPIIIDSAAAPCGLDACDEIGVFDGDLCVGAVVFDGTWPLGINAWKNDPQTGPVDGYVAGHPLTLRIWDFVNQQEIIPACVEFDDPAMASFEGSFYAKLWICGCPCTGPTITVCPAPIDTLICGPGTVCASLTVENADQVVSSYGGTIANGEICYAVAESSNLIDTIVATNGCGADTCIVPVIVTIGTAPTITTCPEPIDVSLCDTGTVCAPLTVEDADQVVSARGGRHIGDQICYTIFESMDMVDTIIATNSCGADTCVVPVLVTIGTAPSFTACPEPIDVALCDSGTVCATLMVENADQVVSSYGGTIANGEICYTITGSVNAVDTIIATNSCGADTCVVPVLVTIGTAPALTTCPEPIDAALCDTGTVCVPLTVENADQVVSARHGRLIGGEICYTIFESIAMVDTIVATNGCGADTCIVPVMVTVGNPPVITTYPDPIDVSLCDTGTVCAPLVIENADSVVSFRGGTCSNGQICYTITESVDMLDTIFATNSCGMDTCVVPITATVGNRPTITTYPDPIDTALCDTGTVCTPLVIEDADSVVSFRGGVCSDGQICYTITGPVDMVDTVLAINGCGTDGCEVPVTVTMQSPPSIGCIDTAIVVADNAPSPYWFYLPVSDQTSVSVYSIPPGLDTWWSGDTLLFEVGTVGFYHVVVDAENDCGQVACTLDVRIDATGPTPTNEWVSLWCETALVDGMPLSEGDVITVTDPDGVLCGMATANAFGGYGYLNVYRDDTYTSADEGAEPGDTLTIWINGVEAMTDPPVVWTVHGDIISVCDFATEVCRTLTLNTGWNLVSWNVEYTAPITAMLAELGGCADVVLSLDDEGGVVYDPDLPQFSTFDTVDYRHGYWFRMLCPATVELCGYPIAEYEVLPVRDGWNLLSYWPDQSLTPPDALVSIIGCVQVVLGFEGGGRVWLPGMDLYNTLHLMSSGFAYWINSSCDTTLAYPGYGGTPAPAPKTFARGATALSPYWLSTYGSNLSLDGEPLASGATVEFRTQSGVVCGSGVYDGRILAFTPVYGSSTVDGIGYDLPREGDEITVWVDGRSTGYSFEWTGQGDRVELSGLASASPENLPGDFRLHQNYPNPFNPSTEIRFDIPNASHVTLGIYNLLGRRVKSLVDGYLEAGNYGLEWNGTDDAGESVASGMYFYRLQAGSLVETKKMLLLK